MGSVLHILSILAVIYFSSVVFSGRGRNSAGLVWATLAVVAVGLFTRWPVHPAAGMLLGLLFPLAFSRQPSPQPMLWALGCAALLAFSGASWVIVPALVAAALWTVGRRSLVDKWGWVTLGGTQSSPPLPPSANGLSVSDMRTSSAAGAVVATAQAEDALSALHHEARLPAAIRAQLLTLDQRTAEALSALSVQGGAASGALYQVRAIRDEYAPASVRAYLNLPPTQANTAPLENGKTGRDLLAEQLDLLLAAAQESLDLAVRSGGQALLTNGRFLRDKFGPAEQQDLKV